MTDLTERERLTELLYRACLAAGTHQAGERVTGTRYWRGHDAPMPVCDTCSVPLPDESVGFRIRGSLTVKDAA